MARLMSEARAGIGSHLDAHFAELHRRFDQLDAQASVLRATLARIVEKPDRI
jgi:hypothetical protein